MEHSPISQVKAPKHAPICLPSWLIGKVEPRELAVILALQAYGASVKWVELEPSQISEACLIPKGALPMLFKKLVRRELIETAKNYDRSTGKQRHLFRLHIWACDQNN